MSGLFGVVPTGQPLITEPAITPSATTCLFALPTNKPFSHIVIFLLPNASIPENSAAAIYLVTAQDVATASQSAVAPNFKFLGGIGPGKESAMFKIDFGATPGDQDLMIGMSIETAESVGHRLQELAANKSSKSPCLASPQGQLPSTAVLAQRIIQNAFNFLAGFSGKAGPGGVEVIPLKAFEDWWRKFESRIRSDPTFLEKQDD